MITHERPRDFEATVPFQVHGVAVASGSVALPRKRTASSWPQRSAMNATADPNRLATASPFDSMPERGYRSVDESATSATSAKLVFARSSEAVRDSTGSNAGTTTAACRRPTERSWPLALMQRAPPAPDNPPECFPPQLRRPRRWPSPPTAGEPPRAVDLIGFGADLFGDFGCGWMCDWAAPVVKRRAR